MTTRINSVDVEQFRGTTFFRLTPHRWGNRAKIKNPEAHAAWLAQLTAEIADAKAKKEGKAPSVTNAAADLPPKNGADLSKSSVTATKRLLVSEALDRLNAHLSETKAAICGPFGVAQQSKVLDGIYVVRNELIETVEAQIKEAQDRLTADWLDPKTVEMKKGFLPDFLADLPAAIERTRTLPLLQGGLGPLFDPKDYDGLPEIGRAHV